MSAVPSVADAKSALRAQHQAHRQQRPPGERDTAAAALTTTLLRRLTRVRAFAAYVPEETEPGHGRLPAAFTQLGARVLLPVVPAEGRELAWAVDTGRLAPGRFGLLEPVGPRLGSTAIGTADVIVVPALAVSRDGVGTGVPECPVVVAATTPEPDAVVVALLFDDELFDELPAEPHDRRVHAVITPAGGWEALPAGH